MHRFYYPFTGEYMTPSKPEYVYLLALLEECPILVGDEFLIYDGSN